MRDLLRSSLLKSMRSLGSLDRLAMAWPVVAGHAIAERSSVAELNGSVATVVVSGDDAWLDQMRRMTPQLRGDLAKVSGVTLTDILFLAADATSLRRSRSVPDPQV
jgi:predicted nucleic acid-binding Zn ribbon protein